MKNQLTNFSTIIIYSFIIFINSCTTPDPVNLPAVITETTVSEITATTAKTGGTVTDEKGETVTVRGVCWGMKTDPTVKDSLTKDGNGLGAFKSYIKNLIPNTTYYIRAYATNKSGISYGNTVTFSTPVDFATIITTPILSITSKTATGGGNITNNGNGTITTRGICWSKKTNPTINDYKTTGGNGDGSFICNLTELLPGTKYYVRAYATNESGTAYGNVEEFISLIDLPEVTTAITTYAAGGKPAYIEGNSAQVSGRIINDGGQTIIAYGLCWSTSVIPTIADSKNTDFTSKISGLTPNTIYYVRAYATTSFGTGYGNQVSFNSGYLKGTLIAGGYVFYNDGAGHGLVCSTSNINQPSQGVHWDNGTSISTGATGTAIGTGKANTTKILNSHGVGNYAAQLCNAIVPIGTWYLPSKDELQLLMIKLGGLSSGYNFSGYWYWSSSESNTTSAWSIESISFYNSTKSSEYYVRAIKEF